MQPRSYHVEDVSVGDGRGLMAGNAPEIRGFPPSDNGEDERRMGDGGSGGGGGGKR